MHIYRICSISVVYAYPVSSRGTKIRPCHLSTWYRNNRRSGRCWNIYAIMKFCWASSKWVIAHTKIGRNIRTSRQRPEKLSWIWWRLLCIVLWNLGWLLRLIILSGIFSCFSGCLFSCLSGCFLGCFPGCLFSRLSGCFLGLSSCFYGLHLWNQLLLRLYILIQIFNLILCFGNGCIDRFDFCIFCRHQCFCCGTFCLCFCLQCFKVCKLSVKTCLCCFDFIFFRLHFIQHISVIRSNLADIFCPIQEISYTLWIQNHWHIICISIFIHILYAKLHCLILLCNIHFCLFNLFLCRIDFFVFCIYLNLQLINFFCNLWYLCIQVCQIFFTVLFFRFQFG